MHRDRPGSGLGLYFTKNLIEQQGGRVWAESELKQGSRFYVVLKRAD
jgi:signal transduction histidine kinase